jgi:lipid A 3-O-deacylase
VKIPTLANRSLFWVTVWLMLAPTTTVFGQATKRPRHEWQFTSDNDVYLFDLYDKYYTNGFQLDFRILLSDSSRLVRQLNSPAARHHQPVIRKVITGLTLNQSLFSPKEIFTRNIDKIDRPYAGWLYLSGSLALFIREKTVLTGGFDAGVTGRWSGGEWMQKRWHAAFGMDPPRNWQYQINNAVVAHVNVLWQQQLIATPSFDLLSETSLKAGNLLTNARQGLSFRLGDIGPMHHSLFTHSRLDRLLPDEAYRQQEIYFFGGLSLERVFANGLIDGNLQDNLHLPTGRSLSWVTHYRYGLTYGTHVWNFSLSVNHLSPEFYEGDSHSYGSIELGFRL